MEPNNPLNAERIMVQVAESLEGRHAFSERLIWRNILRDGFALREEDPAEAKQALEAMDKVIRRATRLTNQLLQLARAQHSADALGDLAQEPIPLASTIQQCIDWLELPGGGFDLTCRLAKSALEESKELTSPLRIVYMPGGIGAVAYNTMVTQRNDEDGTIVAFSGGSLLNLAQGKYGRYNVDDGRCG